MPPNLHDWKMFVKPQELQAHMEKHGLVYKEIVGLVPATNPLTLINLLRKRKRGELSFREAARRIDLARSKDTSNLYMGYAIKI